jgi:putative ABC transport system permease protein
VLFKLAWKNIIHRPLSSGLSVTLLGIAIMIILISGLTTNQLQDNFDSNANNVDLVVGAKGSRLQLVLCNVFHIDNPTGNIDEKSVKFLSNHPFIQYSVPISLGDNYKSYRIIGTTTQFIDSIYNATLNQGDVFNSSMEVVAGAVVAQKLNLSVGSVFSGSHGIGESIHQHEDFEYKVVGVLSRSGQVIDNLLLTPLESVWDVHPENKTKGSFEIKKEPSHSHQGHDHEHASEKNKEITALLIKYASFRGKFTIPSMVNKKDMLMAAEPAIEIQQLFELIIPAIEILEKLAWIILILAVLSMFITLINSMKDRKYEMALMRVSGASSFKIFISVIIEGIFVACLGLLFGLFLGHFFMDLFSTYLSNEYHYYFTGWIIYEYEYLLIIGAVIIGMISALIPAIKAYQIDISKTLNK